jgi:hypothetical protein
MAAVAAGEGRLSQETLDSATGVNRVSLTLVTWLGADGRRWLTG